MQNMIPTDVQAWLDAWQDAIRSCDIAAGKKLFSKTAHGFGTVTYFTTSREDLIERQWRQVWPRTSGFTFDTELAVSVMSEDQCLATVISPWLSNGEHGDGSPRRRQGRGVQLCFNGTRQLSPGYVSTRIFPVGLQEQMSRWLRLSGGRLRRLYPRYKRYLEALSTRPKACRVSRSRRAR